MSVKIKVVDAFEAMATEFPGEVNSGELLTEQAGYIPPKVQIENMILAGQRLDAARGEYDFGEDDEIDEDFIDRTRSSNYDLADASQDLMAVSGRLRDQEAVAKASQAAQDASGDALPEVKVGSEPPPIKGA